MSRRSDLLILGGGGPIGRGIARAATGRSVVVTTRSGPNALDVRDTTSVLNRLSEVRPRALVYLVNDRLATLDQVLADLVGVQRAATRTGVQRFLFASSAAVYGDNGAKPYREDSALVGASDYAWTKIRSEEELARVASAGGPATLSLRIFNVFGPGCDDGLVNRLAAGPPPRLIMTSRFVRDYVHVHDVATAFLAAIDHPDVEGAVNIARGCGVDNLELAAAARRDAFEAVEDLDVRSYSVADVSRAAEQLAWTARIDPLDVVRKRDRPS